MTKVKFGSLLLLCQGILVILFVVFIDDSQDVRYTKIKNGGRSNAANNNNNNARVFQDLHISTFLGFGLIMTFLRRYCRGMLVHVFLIGALVIQWATLLQGFFTMKNTKIEMNITRMINADYAVMAVLVSLGAIMGKCNSLQLLIIAMAETFFFALNETIALRVFKASDFGRSMLVHVFGAYFGLAVSRMIYSRKVSMSQALSMSTKSEMYSFLGTLFLWAYWPSINASLVDEASQMRAMANTFYALAASCSASFSFTVLQSKEGKFNIFHLQNATLAGGVAVGSIAAMSLTPWGAIIVGVVGALGSVLGYKYAVPKLRRRFKIHDTRGVQAAHGIPGILSGIASVLVAILANEEKYGVNLYTLYPARSPRDNSTQLLDLQKFAPIPAGDNRKGTIQALYQLATLAVTLLIAVCGGLLTGLVIRFQFFDPVSINDTFDDHDDFEEKNCIDMSSDIEYLEDYDLGIDAETNNVTLRQSSRRCDQNSNASTPLQSHTSLAHNHIGSRSHVHSEVELDVIGEKEENDDKKPLFVQIDGNKDIENNDNIVIKSSSRSRLSQVSDELNRDSDNAMT